MKLNDILTFNDNDILNTDFSQITLLIDAREKNPDRIRAIAKFFLERSAIVEITDHINGNTLSHCDYSITGFYRDVELNLGIEHKVLLGDLFPSMEKLPTQLFESYRIFSEVALFIEEGNYSLKMTDDGLDGWIQAPAMQAVTGAEGIGTLGMYNEFAGSMAEAGIHVRHYRFVDHFPITVSKLMSNLVKPVHRGLSVKPMDYYTTMMNVLSRLDGVGAKTAEKGLQYITNIKCLGDFDQIDFELVFGKLKGKRLYHFVNDSSRQEVCSRNWQELYDKIGGKPSKCTQIQSKVENKKGVGVISPEPNKKVLNKKIIEKNNSSDYKSLFCIDVFEESKKWYSKVLGFLESKKETERSEIMKAIPDCPEQVINYLISQYLKSGDVYEPRDGVFVATYPKIPEPEPNKPLIVVDSKLPTEVDLAPRVKDVMEYIRQNPRTMEKIQEYFGFSREYTFKTLMEFKLAGKIWYETSTKLWCFGHDRNPMPVVADKEMEVL